MNVLIREGRETDIPAALQLVHELALYEKAPEEVEVSIEQMREWGFGKNPLFKFFVAEQEGKILGMALYYYKYSTWKGKCIFLEDIIVTESQRGGGMGQELFNRTMQCALDENCNGMIWQVLDWNTPAIEFYKKYGAAIDGSWMNCSLERVQLEALVQEKGITSA